MKPIEILIMIFLFTIVSMQFIQLMVIEDDLDNLEDRIAQNIVYNIVTGN